MGACGTRAGGTREGGIREGGTCEGGHMVTRGSEYHVRLCSMY